MSDKRIRQIGEEAIRNHNILLCPAVASTCDRSHMGGLYFESDGIYINVAGTSCYGKFTRQRPEGTHVTLCENLVHETIAMRVSRDVYEGRV